MICLPHVSIVDFVHIFLLLLPPAAAREHLLYRVLHKFGSFDQCLRLYSLKLAASTADFQQFFSLLEPNAHQVRHMGATEVWDETPQDVVGAKIDSVARQFSGSRQNGGRT